MSRITTITFIFAALGISCLYLMSTGASVEPQVIGRRSRPKSDRTRPPCVFNTLAASPSLFPCQVFTPSIRMERPRTATGAVGNEKKAEFVTSCTTASYSTTHQATIYS